MMAKDSLQRNCIEIIDTMILPLLQQFLEKSLNSQSPKRSPFMIFIDFHVRRPLPLARNHDANREG